MQTSPSVSPAKRTSAKIKDAAVPAATTRKPRTRRTLATPAIEIVALHSSGDELADQIEHRVAMTAYFLAEQRNFEPGQELADWLEAERRVRAESAG